MSLQMHQFLDETNLRTIWDVIIDEEIFKFLPRDVQKRVSELFLRNLEPFYENERTRCSNLVEMNKKYIILILSYIKTNFTGPPPSKIKISREAPVKESITFEEIQSERVSEFDKEFAKHEADFQRLNTPPMPTVPKFADTTVDEPIEEMEKLIKEITMKRNYEVEQFAKSFPVQPTQPTQPTFPIGASAPKKSVTYGPDQVFHIPHEDETTTVFEIDLFKKLKKVEPEPEPETRQEIRISRLETQVSMLHNKMDDLLQIVRSNMAKTE